MMKDACKRKRALVHQALVNAEKELVNMRKQMRFAQKGQHWQMSALKAQYTFMEAAAKTIPLFIATQDEPIPAILSENFLYLIWLEWNLKGGTILDAMEQFCSDSQRNKANDRFTGCEADAEWKKCHA